MRIKRLKAGLWLAASLTLFAAGAAQATGYGYHHGYHGGSYGAYADHYRSYHHWRHYDPGYGYGHRSYDCYPRSYYGPGYYSPGYYSHDDYSYGYSGSGGVRLIIQF